MNKSTLTLTALAAVLALSTASSCKKDDDNNSSKSRTQLVTGVWKSDKEGDDANANGLWDTNEQMAVDSNDMATYDFKADGTGTITPTAFPFPIPFNWSLQNGEKDLRLVTTFGGSSDTETVNIVTLTETQAVLKDASSTPVSFFSLKK